MGLTDRLKNIQALIFDMDGVLVDTEPLHMEAFRRFMDALKITYDEDFLFGFIGYSVPDNIRHIYKTRFNITDEKEIEKGIRQRDAIYLQLLNETPLLPLPGVTDLIDFCRENGIKTALASSSDRDQVEVIFKNLQKSSQGQFVPRQIFEVVLTGNDVTNRKPDPEIYRKAAQLLEVDPARCLAIEDSPAGVTAAQKAGMICFALRSHFIDEQKLGNADALLNNLNEALTLLRKAWSA